MAPTSNLAVVICHGSYHSPAPYMPLVEALRTRGIDAFCPQLPTSDLARLNVGDINNPDFDIGPPPEGYPQGAEDVAAVHAVLKPLVDQGKRIIVIGHSSGGWSATESAIPALQAKNHKEGEGGIIGILYMGAFIIPVGESIHSFFQPKDGPAVAPPFMEFHKHGLAGLGTMVDPEKFLFNDLEPSAAQKWTNCLTASPILTTKLSNDAYAFLPCAYLVLDGDLTLPQAYQQQMAALQGSKTGEFKMYHCPAGHSPHLSWTDGVVDTVLDFVNNISG